MRKLVIILSLLSNSIFADSGVDTDLEQIDAHYKKGYKPKGPYLTGPLLTSSAYTIPKGKFNIEPYLFVLDNLGVYGHNIHIQSEDRRHHVIVSPNFQMGLTNYVDLTVTTNYVYCYSVKARNNSGIGDIIIGPSFQLIKDNPELWDLSWKLGLDQLFPCGKFDHLSDEFAGNDILGTGVWTTIVYTAISKLFHLHRENFLAARAALSADFFTPKEINGKTAYGGDATTNGKLYKGVSVVFNIGLEYTMMLNWALALDIETQYSTKSYFRGTTSEPVGHDKDMFNLSLAPAIEYNHNENVGVIFGVWASVYGKNSERFFATVLAVNFFF